MAEFKYDISTHCGVISEKGDWRFELNIVSWNGRKGVYDIRKWHYDDYDEVDKMGKGVTLSTEELRSLYEILGRIFEGE